MKHRLIAFGLLAGSDDGTIGSARQRPKGRKHAEAGRTRAPQCSGDGSRRGVCGGQAPRHRRPHFLHPLRAGTPSGRRLHDQPRRQRRAAAAGRSRVRAVVARREQDPGRDPTAAPSGSSTPTTAATPSCRLSTPTSGCFSAATSGRPTARGSPVRASATSRAPTASTRSAPPTAATCGGSRREPTTITRATILRTASASCSCARRSTPARSRSIRPSWTGPTCGSSRLRGWGCCSTSPAGAGRRRGTRSSSRQARPRASEAPSSSSTRTGAGCGGSRSRVAARPPVATSRSGPGRGEDRLHDGRGADGTLGPLHSQSRRHGAPPGHACGLGCGPEGLGHASAEPLGHGAGRGEWLPTAGVSLVVCTGDTGVITASSRARGFATNRTENSARLSQSWLLQGPALHAHRVVARCRRTASSR